MWSILLNQTSYRLVWAHAKTEAVSYIFDFALRYRINYTTNSIILLHRWIALFCSFLMVSWLTCCFNIWLSTSISPDLSQLSHQLQFSFVHSGHAPIPSALRPQRYNRTITSFIGWLWCWYCLVAFWQLLIERSSSKTFVIPLCPWVCLDIQPIRQRMGVMPRITFAKEY